MLNDVTIERCTINDNFLLSFSYKLLHVLEFDSTRKRMSVIVSETDGKRYRILTRGGGGVFGVVLESLLQHS